MHVQRDPMNAGTEVEASRMQIEGSRFQGIFSGLETSRNAVGRTGRINRGVDVCAQRTCRFRVVRLPQPVFASSCDGAVSN